MTKPPTPTKAELHEMLAEAVRNTQPQPVRNTQPEPVRDVQPEPVRDVQPEPKRNTRTRPAPKRKRNLAAHDLRQSARSRSKEFAVNYQVAHSDWTSNIVEIKAPFSL